MDPNESEEIGEEDEQGYIVVTAGAKVMMRQYHMRPPTYCIEEIGDQSVYNIKHHRTQVDFYNPSAGQYDKRPPMNRVPIFPKSTPKQKIAIIGIGIKSWFADNNIPLGIKFETGKSQTGETQYIQGPISMGDEKCYSYTLPTKGQDPKAYEMIYASKPQTEVSQKFKDWRIDISNLEKGVGETKDKVTKEMKFALELPKREGDPVECPLAVFRAMLLGENPFSGHTVNVNYPTYVDLLEKFKECVGDGRIHVHTDNFHVRVDTLHTSWYNSSMVIDVFFSELR